jgi:hypothetical protein
MGKKRYPLHQSPFYKLVGLGRLEKTLGVDLKNLSRLLVPENYHVWINKKNREIQQPTGWLKHVHEHIGQLLSRIDVPAYVFSQKGRSYIDNAKQHCNSHPLGKTDITKFYTSTTRSMVHRMFTELFKCASDVAGILADICCYLQKHLPTGSALSGRVAFFSALPMFEEVNTVSLASGNTMTLYVDDITVSGPGATKKLMSEIRQIVRRHGLCTKKSKTKTFAPNSVKSVTGVMISQNQLCLPNIRHKRIKEVRQALRDAAPCEQAELRRSLAGRLQEAQQISAANTCKQAA